MFLVHVFYAYENFFNYSIDITDYHTKRILRRKASFFEYGNIKNIKVSKPNGKYVIWENNDIVDRESQ